MKFARYLRETQIPEWEKAYIDYRSLKKRISTIQRAEQKDPESSPAHGTLGSGSPIDRDAVGSSSSGWNANTTAQVTVASGMRPSHRGQLIRSKSRTAIFKPGEENESKRPALHSLVNLRRSKNLSRQDVTSETFSLRELMPILTTREREFLQVLDSQLSKIESFYLDRELEMRSRSEAIQEQIRELDVHRALWETREKTLSRAARLTARLRFPSILHNRPMSHFETKQPAQELAEGQGEQTAKEGTEAAFIGPEDYFHARRKLKKAVLEHYRGLILLNNYRTLNLQGCQKMLKKFAKATKIPIYEAYYTEKIRPCSFASGSSILTMIGEIENLFTARFFHGDRKKALKSLRSTYSHRTYHSNTFFSGIILGISMPALASGVYMSFQYTARAAIPGWDKLLLVYAVFFIPVVHALLVGLNMVVWSRMRINYPFILDLDSRTRLDYRQYIEIPSILFTTLCYAFWLSFFRVGSSKISPTIWPIVWLVTAICLLIEPLPFLSKPARFWFHKRMGRLLVPGFRRVEFIDFWLGDQLCSMTFSLSHLYNVGCVYARGFGHFSRGCNSNSTDWVAPFLLSSLPLLVRTIQSVRRYYDSGLFTHLINGGKYGAGVIAYLLFALWQHSKNSRGVYFILWCMANSFYSMYASSWDFFMDWSVLQPRAKYPFLRGELIYTEYVPLYYIAIITNLLIRFIWVLYIPNLGLSLQVRGFIAAMLEILRRWQWNFFRMENEHLGNMDQYRALKEIPLPYHMDVTGQIEDDHPDTDIDTRLGPANRKPKDRDEENREDGENSESSAM